MIRTAKQRTTLTAHHHHNNMTTTITITITTINTQEAGREEAQAPGHGRVDIPEHRLEGRGTNQGNTTVTPLRHFFNNTVTPLYHLHQTNMDSAEEAVSEGSQEGESSEEVAHCNTTVTLL
jgi:hypothetical protein